VPDLGVWPRVKLREMESRSVWGRIWGFDGAQENDDRCTASGLRTRALPSEDKRYEPAATAVGVPQTGADSSVHHLQQGLSSSMSVAGDILVSALLAGGKSHHWHELRCQVSAYRPSRIRPSWEKNAMER